VQLPLATPVKLRRSQEARVRADFVYLAAGAVVVTVVALAWGHLHARLPQGASTARIESVAVLPCVTFPMIRSRNISAMV